MGRFKNGVSRSKLGRRYQSDFINVSQRPRALIIDPICDRCRGKKLRHGQMCRRCLGTGKDPEGDKWFDNHDRVKTTYGPKNDQTPLGESTFVERVYDPKMHKITKRAETDNPDTKSVVIYREYRGGFKPTERDIPPTIGIGTAIVNNQGRLETAATSAINYTYDHLPKLDVADKIERIRSSLRLTVVERMDKFISIRRDASSHLKLFFAGDKYCFREEFVGWSRRSMVYTGAEFTMNIAKRPSTIVWEETVRTKKAKPEVPDPKLNMVRLNMRAPADRKK